MDECVIICVQINILTVSREEYLSDIEILSKNTTISEMGYDYYILVQGLQEGEWKDLNYSINSGSYGSSHNHYFFEKMARGEPCGCKFKKEMGEYQYLFEYKTICEDFKKYSKTPDDTPIKGLLSKLGKSELTRVDLVVIRNEIDDILEGEREEFFMPELERYYRMCQNYKKAYSDVRVVYGFSP